MAFLAKAAFDVPTLPTPVNRQRIDPTLHHLCG